MLDEKEKTFVKRVLTDSEVTKKYIKSLEKQASTKPFWTSLYNFIIEHRPNTINDEEDLIDFYLFSVAPSCVYPKSGKFCCVLCDIEYKKTAYLVRHYREKHFFQIPKDILGPEAVFTCEPCNTKYSRKEYFTQHLLSELHKKNTDQDTENSDTNEKNEKKNSNKERREREIEDWDNKRLRLGYDDVVVVDEKISSQCKGESSSESDHDDEDLDVLINKENIPPSSSCQQYDNTTRNQACLAIIEGQQFDDTTRNQACLAIIDELIGGNKPNCSKYFDDADQVLTSDKSQIMLKTKTSLANEKVTIDQGNESDDYILLKEIESMLGDKANQSQERRKNSTQEDEDKNEEKVEEATVTVNVLSQKLEKKLSLLF